MRRAGKESKEIGSECRCIEKKRVTAVVVITAE